MTRMCNINLVYFAASVLVCLFVSDDFRSGYAKNLFTVRAGRMEYVISKTLVGVISGVLMLIAYFIGSMLGGKIAGLTFAMEGFTASGVVMCMLAKSLLAAVFVPLYLLMSVIAREKTWLSILLYGDVPVHDDPNDHPAGRRHHERHFVPRRRCPVQLWSWSREPSGAAEIGSYVSQTGNHLFFVYSGAVSAAALFIAASWRAWLISASMQMDWRASSCGQAA